MMNRRVSGPALFAGIGLFVGFPALAEPAPAAPAPPAPVETTTPPLPDSAPPTAAPVSAETKPVDAATKAEEPAATLPAASPDDSFTSTDASATDIMSSEEGPKLELYGFADVSYMHVLNEKSNILRQYLSSYPSFFVGHFNLYLSSQLGENWRSLAEVRFVYTPLGDEDKQAANGTFPAVDNTAYDYAELQRTFSWNGIEIQRVWLEYQPFDFMNIRAGQWFTPYGYWNDDHGSPTIIAVHKPFPIGDQMFPEKQTGIEVHGKYFIDSTALGYALTLSNGRGPYDAIRDLDNNKAVGGRVYVETTALGSLGVGVAAYRGVYTASTKRYRVDTSGAEPVAEIYRHVDTRYDELSLGADLRWQWHNVHLQAEVMENEAAYADSARPRVVGFDPRPTFTADYRRMGGYVLLGYRTPWLNLMPYGMLEHSSYTDSDFAPPVSAWTAGVNLRPTPNVVLKAEISAAKFYGVGSTGLGRDGLSYFGTQAAWAY